MVVTEETIQAVKELQAKLSKNTKDLEKNVHMIIWEIIQLRLTITNVTGILTLYQLTFVLTTTSLLPLSCCWILNFHVGVIPRGQ